MAISSKSVIVAAVVSVAAILTGALVGGRVYGPTYYAQYGGNLQPAAENRQSGNGDYELYYNHEDRNYYYRQKQYTNQDPNYPYARDQGGYNHRYVDRQTNQRQTGTFASRIVDVGRGVWSYFTSGFRKMANGIRRTFYGDNYVDDRQTDFVGGLLSSPAWTVPAAGVASGLLFRNEIEDVIENLIGDCAGWRNLCDDPNVDTCYKGDCYCGENRGAPCVNTTSTCSGGICKCGTKDACTGKTVDTCTKDTKTGRDSCTCGGASECSGQTDTCTEGVCKCGTGSKCTGMQSCVSGACKCGDNSDCMAADLVDTCTAGECSCNGNTCNTDVSDSCTGGVCKCGTSAACTGSLKCTNGACACSMDSDCDATKANKCDNGVCKCGAAAVCGTDATLVKCLAADGSAATASDAKCHCDASCTGATPECCPMGGTTHADKVGTCQATTGDCDTAP